MFVIWCQAAVRLSFTFTGQSSLIFTVRVLGWLSPRSPSALKSVL